MQHSRCFRDSGCPAHFLPSCLSRSCTASNTFGIGSGTSSIPKAAKTARSHSLMRWSPVERVADPSRRYFFRTASVLAGATPFFSTMYGFAAERLNYQVRRVEIPMANLPPALDGMQIAQISDIHLSGYMSRVDVRRAVDMTNELGADLTVVTGDFITGSGDPDRGLHRGSKPAACAARRMGLQRQSRNLRQGGRYRAAFVRPRRNEAAAPGKRAAHVSRRAIQFNRRGLPAGAQPRRPPARKCLRIWTG